MNILNIRRLVLDLDDFLKKIKDSVYAETW